MVDVWLRYGKTEVCARIPTRNFLGMIKPKQKPGVEDPRAEVVRALNEPIGSRRLSEIAEAGVKAAVVVDDATRATPSYLMVPPILDELNKAGVRDYDTTVIFGCGTHRPVTPEEMKVLVGAETLERVKTISHDCQAKDLIYLGKTQKLGTKVHVNKTFAEAEVKVLTGDIGLHYYAGYGGCRKSVLPAISGIETIQRNHAAILHPKARTGSLEGNPIHEDMVEAAKLAKPDFVLNIVTNSHGELVQAFAGDMEAVHAKGVELVDEMYRVTIERRAKIVVVSPGGHPFDIDLYQAYKGVDCALEAVRRGGVIIWVAECPEGHGNQVFYEWMTKFKELRQVETEIKRRFKVGGNKAYFLMKALQKVKIILVSSLPDYYAADVFKLKTAKAVNDALHKAFSIAGRDAKVWVMPHGNVTLPMVKTTELPMIPSSKQQS